MKKRILPVLLALCMVMSLLPVAFAATVNCTCDKNTHPGSHTATFEGDAEGLCDACKTSHDCNPCSFSDCKSYEGHAGNHTNDTCGATDSDGKCGASTHLDGCDLYVAPEEPDGNECTGDENCTAPAGSHGSTCPKYEKCDAGADGEGNGGCAKDKNHEGAHDSANCTKDSQCAATTHDATCPKACGVGGCTKTAGHTKNTAAQGQPSNATPHNNTKCLGYNDDGFCGFSGTHIAGCGEYDCHCGPHTDTGFNDSQEEGFVALTCTHKAGCPLCAAWNSYVSGKVAEYNAAHKTWAEKKAAHDKWEAADEATRGEEPAAPGAEPTLNEKYVACDCADCRPNPAMGAVVDAEGNEVDPAEPTEPTTPKAEDFTDMEDWMVADVQTVLDKGWLQGEGETFNGRGVTTGATIAAVLARMDGEEITGTTWAQDALAWAEGKDVFEGIELTGESMARKDLVLVIWRMADKPESDFELTFTDVDGLEGDHLTAMKWAAENGIVKGNGDDTVTPDGAVNRAALCAMLARYDGLEK